ncbi:MAG: ABC transporter substrate-binding protein [Lachnospiraceae bacterium]|nr:ABC transporter substrate-binding protein [Lachnospiraceae bacterium]
MKNSKMKKAMALLLTGVIAFAGNGIDGTVSAYASENNEITDLIQASTSSISTWCIYHSKDKPGVLANFVDPLVTVDEYNTPQPCLAESWSTNEDETVWTFYLREGVTWVDYEGNYKGDVTSEDWLYGLEWVLNFWKNDSFQTTLPMSILQGAQDYYEYTKSLTEEEALALGVDKLQEMVGIETPDSYTVVYTCINSCAYFESLATSVFLFPLAKGQLDEVGVENYKSIEPDELWYCGPYTIESWEDDNYWTIVPNEAYWDTEVSRFDSVTTLKVDSTDTAWELFLNGEINYPGALSTSTVNLLLSDSTSEWHDYVAKSAASSVTWGIFFNYAKNKEDDTPDTDWNTAVANENFRKCFYYGLDLYNYYATIDPANPESVAHGALTSSGLCSLSDGTDYTSLVYDLIDYDPVNGDYSHQDLDKLAEYKAAAIEELSAQGVTFPIQIDMYSASTQSSVDTYTIFKEVLEDSLGTDFVQVNLHTYISSKLSEVYNTSYFSVELQGYGGLYSDPLTFLSQLCSDMSGNAEWSDMYGHVSDCTDEETVALFDEFTQMVREADAITGDSDARYEALAEAEAFAIEHVLMIPTHARSGYEITPVNTYSKISRVNDTLCERYINWETKADYYTAAEIESLREAHLAGSEG